MRTSSHPYPGIVLVMAAVLSLAASPATAEMGNNGGGALYVHFDPDIHYTANDLPPSVYFGQFQDACPELGEGEDCEDYRILYDCHYGQDLDPDLPDDPVVSIGGVMWVCVVLPDTTCAEIAAVEFGLGDITGEITFVDYGTYHYAGGTAIATPIGDWPSPGSGIRIEFDPPLTSHVAPLLYITGVPTPNALTPLGPYPQGPLNSGIFFYDSENHQTEAITDPDCEYATAAWFLDDMGCNPSLGDVPLTWVCCILGECFIMHEQQCLDAGGDWQPELYSCDPNPCPAAAACCFEDGSCIVMIEDDCLEADGEWLAQWDSCDPNPCPQPERACCFEDGSCEIMTEEDCLGTGGDWLAQWDYCEPNPCPIPPDGVCCYGEVGEDCTVIPEYECQALEGVWHADWDSCDPNPCILPPPLAVCCIEDACSITTEEECVGAGAVWHADWDSCDPNPCPSRGVCCMDNGECLYRTHQTCDNIGGTWLVDVPSCEHNPCRLRVCCLGTDCNIRRQGQCVDMGGDWKEPYDSCDPNQCDPYTPTHRRTWG